MVSTENVEVGRDGHEERWTVPTMLRQLGNWAGGTVGGAREHEHIADPDTLSDCDRALLACYKLVNHSDSTAAWAVMRTDGVGRIASRNNSMYSEDLRNT